MIVTVHDIARAANVSRGTVHRALHDRPGVSQATRQKVLSIAKHLDYKPYVAARVLATQKKLLIPIIVPIDENEDPFWHEVKAGLCAITYEIWGVGMETQWVVPGHWDPSDQIALMEEFIDRRVDGIAIAPVDPDDLREVIDKAVDSGIPVVTFNTDAPKSRRICLVGQDSLTAGRVAGELMNEILGGEGIVHISIQQDPFFQGYESISILYKYLLINHPPEEYEEYIEIPDH